MAKDKVTPAVASDLANLFDALSDPTRILIISALIDGEVGVGDLVERFKAGGVALVVYADINHPEVPEKLWVYAWSPSSG